MTYPSSRSHAPFTDLDDQGVEGVFSLEDGRALVDALRDVRRRAAA
jgi:hypothetical protein